MRGMFGDLEGKYEANEVVVQQLMRTNIEGSLKVHACHLGEGRDHLNQMVLSCNLGGTNSNSRSRVGLLQDFFSLIAKLPLWGRLKAMFLLI